MTKPHKITLSIYQQVAIPTLSMEVVEDVRLFLLQWKFKPSKDEEWLVAFQIRNTVQELCRLCQCKELPKALDSVVVQRAVGNVLLFLRQSGRFSALMTTEEAVKTVQTGDISVTFSVDGSLSQENLIENYIKALVESGEGELGCYRKLRW